MSVTGFTKAMVSAKKARRVRRARYSRRRYKRLRRRFRRYRRTRRFPKNTEVKSVNKHFSGQITATNTGDNANVTFTPGYAISIGGSETLNIANNLSIAQGTGLSQRVGAKVEPIKLRISGSFSLVGNTLNQPQYAPNFWQVRCIVFQVKGANASHGPNNDDYHQMSMTTVAGDVGATQIRRVLAYYQSVGDAVFSNAHWLANNGIAYTPLRRGIGHLCHILYKKTFWINTQKNPIKQFRFLTRKPKRLVYPETVDGAQANNIQGNANDCIYVLFLFQPGNFDSRSQPALNYNVIVDMFYTDK